jgi:EpsD family peptidyl-prolyl cis-trans isomerase
MYRKASIAIALASLSLAGCGKEATGQVAAVVNGEEITLQEINAELGNTPIPEGVDKKVIQQAALQKIVERRLLAQAAREDGLDKTPDYLLRERQLRDALLVQLMGQRAERALKVPDQQEIDKFIGDNPLMFAERKILTIDRIQFALPEKVDQLKALENDHSMDAVAARLQQMGIQFRRDTPQVDAASLGQQRMAQIRALPAGEPFVVPENGVVTVGVIVGERPEPVSASDARPLAVQALRKQKLTETVQQRLKQGRAAAKIDYQEGFAPAADKAKGTAEKK